MAKSMDPEQTAPVGAVCSGSTLFASILNSSVKLGNYLQQTTSADDIFRCIGALRVKRRQINCIQVRRRAIYKKCNVRGPKVVIALRSSVFFWSRSLPSTSSKLLRGGII